WPVPARPAGPRSAQPCNGALTSGSLAFATVGEVALVADRARGDVTYPRDPDGKQPLAGDRTQIDLATVAVDSVEGRVHLLADLIAARPGTRAHQRKDVSAPADLAQSEHALLEHSAGKPAP